MALRQIAKLGKSEILNKKCREVTVFDDRLGELIDDMLETCLDAQGVGLAAPQVSILKRVIVVALEDYDKFTAIVNPVIVEQSGEQMSGEGCLSIPGRFFDVKRPTSVVVHGFDRNGNKIIVTGKGAIACRLCHEIDHLDGNTIANTGEEVFEN